MIPIAINKVDNGMTIEYRNPSEFNLLFQVSMNCLTYLSVGINVLAYCSYIEVDECLYIIKSVSMKILFFHREKSGLRLAHRVDSELSEIMTVSSSFLDCYLEELILNPSRSNCS